VRDLVDEFGYGLHHHVEGVVADVAGSVREHMREEEGGDVLPALFGHAALGMGYRAVMIKISMMLARQRSLLVFSSRYL
jgi:hypothetical protein